LVGDFDLAEECAQEAFAVALERWPIDGVPAQPRAWLVGTARHKAIDRIRHRQLERSHAERERWLEVRSAELELHALADDRLRLLFTCCHPVLAPEAQIALTLRALGGLTTEEIARAFLASVPTLQQRIVRAKALLAERAVPYEVPEASELPERLPSVLTTLYLMFNEGHSASTGQVLLRADVCEEAISLARALHRELPDEAGPVGLLGLLLLTHARRAARVDGHGELVTLDRQDRSLWDRPEADEGRALVKRALGMAPLTRFALQGAIAAVHADAATSEETDWRQITALYSVHMRLAPSPIVALNACVAFAFGHDVKEGLARLEALTDELTDYAPFHAAHGELLERTGLMERAAGAYLRASELAGTEPERRHLLKRAERVRSPGNS
jgi:RNA polymerase sigma-70 factor (ECF subfamily)